MKTANKRVVLNALVFLSAIASIVLDYLGSSLYYLFKPVTTLLVLCIPLLVKVANSIFKRLLILALCFCLLGDVLLMNPEYFVFGLGAFLVAHLLFATAFIKLNGFQKNNFAGLGLLMIGLGLYTWLYPDLGALKLPVAVYVLVIVFMSWQGISMYLREKTIAFSFIAIGVLLFMFSDSMIAVNKFKTPFEFSGAVILSTYWLAIALIANAGVRISKKRE